jgi:hypothetical protein
VWDPSAEVWVPQRPERSIVRMPSGEAFAVVGTPEEILAVFGLALPGAS